MPSQRKNKNRAIGIINKGLGLNSKSQAQLQCYINKNVQVSLYIDKGINNWRRHRLWAW
jgi:hypothetical protein